MDDFAFVAFALVLIVIAYGVGFAMGRSYPD